MQVNMLLEKIGDGVKYQLKGKNGTDLIKMGLALCAVCYIYKESTKRQDSGELSLDNTDENSIAVDEYSKGDCAE